jgi:hypothetical protein
MRRMSSQGFADYSCAHRETNTQEAGKIPGYSEMNFAQRRATQISERLKTDPNFARGSRGGRDER